MFLKVYRDSKSMIVEQTHVTATPCKNFCNFRDVHLMSLFVLIHVCVVIELKIIHKIFRALIDFRLNTIFDTLTMITVNFDASIREITEYDSLERQNYHSICKRNVLCVPLNLLICSLNHIDHPWSKPPNLCISHKRNCLEYSKIIIHKQFLFYIALKRAY